MMSNRKDQPEISHLKRKREKRKVRSVGRVDHMKTNKRPTSHNYVALFRLISMLKLTSRNLSKLIHLVSFKIQTKAIMQALIK